MFGGLAAPPPVEVPYKKAPLEVKTKMKVLHWKPLQLDKIKDTCWNALSDQGVAFDASALESGFGIRKTKRKKGGGVGAGERTDSPAAGSRRKKKKEIITLVDTKRSNNINIALARFKMSHDMIRDSLLRMDEEALDEDKLLVLQKCKPEADEISMVNGFQGDVTHLGNCEQFFRKIVEIPNVQFRIDSFVFKVRFEATVASMQGSVDTLKVAARTLRDSERFQHVLEYVLAVGNYLNNANKKGGAYGVKLDSLNKLKGMKSSDGKSNLLEFVIVQLQGSEGKAADAVNFPEDFTVLREAKRVDVGDMERTLNKTQGMVNRINNALKKARMDTSDRYGPVMKEFHAKAGARLSDLKADMKKVVAGFTDLIAFYGEDTKKCSTSDFLEIFLEFTGTWEKVCEVLERRRKVEERQKKRDTTPKQEKRKEKKEQKQKSDSKNKIGQALGSLRNTDSSKIRAALRRRQKFGTIGKLGKNKKKKRNSNMAMFERALLKRLASKGEL